MSPESIPALEDALFEQILQLLEHATELAASVDRNKRLTELARVTTHLDSLTQAAMRAAEHAP